MNRENTHLRKGNKLFNNKDYDKAITEYLFTIKELPELKEIIEFNIALSKKRKGLPLIDPEMEKFISSSIANLDYQDDPRIELANPSMLEPYYFERIVESGLFDPVYYLENYASLLYDVDNLLEHYLTEGQHLKLNPSSSFDTAYYERVNPDVLQAGVLPFIHYVCNGREEGREAIAKPYSSVYEVAKPEYIPRLPKSAETVQKLVRPICFYLPQFHPIPENDEWWGKGFTEWTNVKPAVPQFEGHYQPHVPDDYLGYYNLLERDTQAKQIELAKQYGIEGFCYYLYWFSGQRLLEQPLDNMLADPTLDFPFCVCWANENWSRRWDGLENDLLMVQNYSIEDDLAFIANVAKYLKDSRYIKVNDKPLLMIYRPNLFPNMKATSARWRQWCRENGIGEIYLAYTQSFESEPPEVYGFDAAIEFPPNNSNPPKIIDQVKNLKDDFGGMVYDWRVFLERSEAYEDKPYKLFRSATPSWDNTARKKSNGNIFHNSCPKLFTKNLVNVFNETIQKNDNPDERLVFINAWNEWAEGAHLEPDQRYGYSWLQAVYDAHQKTSQSRKRILVVSHDAHPHGAQILSMNFAKEFSQKLHFDVEMIVLGEGVMLSKFAQYANVQQINLDTIDKAELMQKLTVLRNKSIDVAIVNTTVSGKLTPYLKQAGFAVVSLIHELPSVLSSMKLKEHAQAIAANADKIVFPAHQVQQGFENFIGKSIDNFEIRPQGLFHPSIIHTSKTKEACRQELLIKYKLPHDAKIFVNVAYADYRKGFDIFCEVSQKLFEANHNIYSIWIGHLDTKFVEDSINKYIKPSYRRNLILTNGFVDQPGIYYAGADVFALTSREDPFPSVVLEALDALTPVVAFKDCGGFENLLSRDSGLLVEKDNVGQYSKALEQLLNDKHLAQKLAQTGQHIVQTELSFYHYLFDLLEFAGKPLPKISVAVPNYNYAKYIESRLDSILKQSFPIYELIILDDVSTDNSVEVIKEYLKNVTIPYRFIINDTNSGSVFKQWRKAAELAKGDYLWLAEADDLAEPKFIEKLIPFFEDDLMVMAFSQSKQIDQDSKQLANDYLDYTNDVGNYWNDDYTIDGEEEIKRALCIKNTIPNVSGVLLKNDTFLQALVNLEYQLPNYKVAGDWLVYIQMLKNGKIGFCRESLNLHRRHVSSVTKVNNHLDEIIAVHKLVEGFITISTEQLNRMERYANNIRKHFDQVKETLK